MRDYYLKWLRILTNYDIQYTYSRVIYIRQPVLVKDLAFIRRFCKDKGITYTNIIIES